MQSIGNLFRSAILVSAVALVAQAASDRGVIQGTATDSQGALFPKVTVIVTNKATGLVHRVSTNDAGFYSVTELVPGTYSVEFSAPGFSKLDISNVELQAGTKVTIDGPMKVGGVAETVNVTAENPLVESTPSNFTTSIQSELIDKVPLVGRDIQSIRATASRRHAVGWADRLRVRLR